ncbi:hypothetical protein, partial [Exiguobacterium sp. s157]|uniref:hypothetical protein n=1 Tax=Exiguobacterium sp. s157 TaxID=2751233 RepID=UPI001BE633D8
MKKWVSLLVVMLLVFSSFDWRVFGEEDLEGPKFLSHSISPGQYTVGDMVQLEAVVKDDATGVSNVLFYLRKPTSGGSLYVSMYHQGDGRYTGNLQIVEGMEAGRYVLDRIAAYDNQGNYSRLDGDESDQWFEAVDTKEDIEGPKFLSHSISPGQYTVGDMVQLEAVVKDDAT